MVIQAPPKLSAELLQELQATLLKEQLNSHASMTKSIKDMSRSELMDNYLTWLQKSIGTPEICETVNIIFGIDLLTKPLLPSGMPEDLKNEQPSAQTVIDFYLSQYQFPQTGKEIRQMINLIFGINLDGLSGLVGKGIGLYTKGAWFLRAEDDLFIIHTGTGDVDVKIDPTDYFKQETGLKELPAELQQALSTLGFYNHPQLGSFYYRNPSGEAVPDSFKGQTMGTIRAFIHKHYQHLLQQESSI